MTTHHRFREIRICSGPVNLHFNFRYRYTRKQVKRQKVVSLLTLRAEIRAALCLYDSTNGRATSPTGRALAVIHGKPLHLKDAWPVPDPLPHRRDDTPSQRSYVGKSQPVCPTTGVDPRTPQRLARVDVADAGHQALVQQGNFDWTGGPLQSCQIIPIQERIGPESFQNALEFP
jgi:hypothetical protein